MRKILPFVMVAIMLTLTTLPTTTVSAREYWISIEINGETHYTTEENNPVLYPAEDGVWVPLRFVAEELGYAISWDKKTKSVGISAGDGNIYRHVPGTDEITDSYGDKTKLPHKSYNDGGVTMVPYDLFRILFNDIAAWNPDGPTVTFSNQTS